MSAAQRGPFVSRGGDKLAAALDHFEIAVRDFVCADLGSHVGGFVDCLLQRGAARVYSIDTSYGTLAWKLRKDPRVIVLERTNAMHVTLPEPAGNARFQFPSPGIHAGRGFAAPGASRHETRGSARSEPASPVDLVTIDVGWTPQARVLPNAAKLLSPTGRVLTLIKPHYEAPPDALTNGVLPDDQIERVVAGVLEQTVADGWQVEGTFVSPIRGQGGNREVFALLQR